MSNIAEERRLEDLRHAVDVARSGARRSAAPVASAVARDGSIDQTAVAFNVFANLLATDGVRAALYSILRRSSYRFIGIFRFRDGMATSSVHVDRDNLAITQADEVPETATYCSYVRSGNQPFVTADAPADSRTIGHPARSVILSYCGIPIMESDGTLIGTLCHYDVVPRDPEELDLELLLQVSSALARSGLVPPYPNLPAPDAG